MSLLTKNTVPTLVSLLLFGASYIVIEPFQLHLRTVGLFAFSGAITNWLAVYMLFERIPGLYGSGVIPARFEELKAGLFRLVKDQLFKAENVKKAFDKDQSTSGLSLDFEPIIDSIDMDSAYEQLKKAIMESSFGNVLNMVGGEAVLEPLREKITQRLRQFIQEATTGEKFQAALSAGLSKVTGSDVFLNKIEEIVQTRLDELTPDMVNDIMKAMIRKHLGWLVVWGAVFGGLLGLGVSLLGL